MDVAYIFEIELINHISCKAINLRSCKIASKSKTMQNANTVWPFLPNNPPKPTNPISSRELPSILMLGNRI